MENIYFYDPNQNERHKISHGLLGRSTYRLEVYRTRTSQEECIVSSEMDFLCFFATINYPKHKPFPITNKHRTVVVVLGCVLSTYTPGSRHRCPCHLTQNLGQSPFGGQNIRTSETIVGSFPLLRQSISSSSARQCYWFRHPLARFARHKFDNDLYGGEPISIA